MNLSLDGIKSVIELQSLFNRYYPYLRIDFSSAQENVRGRANLIASSLVRKQNEIDLNISDLTTVNELEKRMLEVFGLNIQVSRKTGGAWVGISMTRNWTLKRQNEFGREISEDLSPPSKPPHQ